MEPNGKKEGVLFVREVLEHGDGELAFNICLSLKYSRIGTLAYSLLMVLML